MRALLIASLLAPLAAACAQPYEAMPTSGYQWQRRQDAIERQWRDAQPKPEQTPSTGAAAAPKDRF
jgi:hypothetical protein|nr:hypothetical protein [uncultured Brevundimonas sp.]